MNALTRKQTATVFKLGLLLLLVFALVMPISIAQDENLLTNPGFEDAFVTEGNDELRTVATGWHPWHIARTDDMPSFQNARPYYIGSTTANASGILPRVRSGSQSQIYYSFFETHDGGIYQQVSGIAPGTELRFSIYGHVWSSAFSDFNVSDQDGSVALRVGIDPLGGTDPDASSVVYSTPGIFYDTFRQYSVIATAQSDTVTVFVRTTIAEVVRNTVVYLDDAVLEITPESNGGAVTEVPTEEPTEEPVATEEPTVAPTEVPTEEPTEEPVATEEPTVEDPTPTLEGNVDTPTEEPVATQEPTVEVPTDEPATEEPTEEPTAQDPTPTQEGSDNGGLVPTSTVISVEPTATEETGGGTEGPSGPISDEFPGQIIHVVRRGDTVGAIATLYGSSIEAITEANGLENNALIFVNQSLIVPVRIVPATIVPSPTPVATAVPDNNTGGSESSGGGSAPATGTEIYIVRPGDTLLRIARLYNTTVGTLVQLNGIANPNRIYYGQRLIVPVVGSAQPVPVTYTVQYGDYLLRIAIRYGVSVTQLAEANGISNINRIFPGQVLTIPQS